MFWAFPNIMLNKKFKIYPSKRIATCEQQHYYDAVEAINWKFRARKFEEGLYKQVLYYHDLYLKYTDNLVYQLEKHKKLHKNFCTTDIMDIKRSKLPIRLLRVRESIFSQKQRVNQSQN